METALWAKAHGASTHLPLALAFCSTLFDTAGLALAGRPIVRDLHAAGYWALLGGAIGSVPAVVSGLLMTKGSIVGHGALRMHHLFVWPAFTLLIALATWRVVMGRRMTRGLLAGYVIAAGVMSGLLLGAGYWGGEMMAAVQ